MRSLTNATSENKPVCSGIPPKGAPRLQRMLINSLQPARSEWRPRRDAPTIRTSWLQLVGECDKLTPTKITGANMADTTIQRRMKNLLLFVPNLVYLSGRLMVDPRVPAKERLLVGGAIVYAVLPFDLIPDMLPFVGQVDDAYLIALTLLRLMTVTEPRVVREHWRGGGDVVELIGSTALIAARLLPKRIRRVLTAQIEAPKNPRAGRSDIAMPLLVEKSTQESKHTN